MLQTAEAYKYITLTPVSYGACVSVNFNDGNDSPTIQWSVDVESGKKFYSWGQWFTTLNEVVDCIQLVGDEAITGSDWAASEDNILWANESVFTLTRNNVVVASDGDYSFRVLPGFDEDCWNARFPHTNAENWHESINLTAGTYDITFTYNPSTDALTASATAASGGSEEEEDELNPSHPLDPGSYLVTVQVGNAAAGTVTGAGYYAQGATATIKATANTGYEFVQWSDGVTTNPRSLTIKRDTTITAEWSKLSYTINFVDEDGTTALCDPLNVEYGDVPVFPGSTPTKAATAQYTFTFSGWSPAIAAVTSAQTYVATYSSTVNEYQITFNANGHGTAPASQTVAYGSKVTKPADPTAEGYTFGGWYKEAACTNAWNFNTATVTGAQELFAKWTIQSFTLSWDVNGGDALSGTYTHGTVVYGTAIVAPADPTRTGYTFAGWDPAVAETMPAADVTYTATWTEAGDTPYKVEHYQQNLVGNDYTLIDTDNLTGKTGASITPASKGYTGFAAPTYDAATIAANGSTVMKLYYDRLTFTIAFEVEGVEVHSDVLRYGATPAYNGTEPTKAATAQYTYAFNGWSPAIADVTAAQTYVAVFSSTVNEYQITFNANGHGTAPAAQTIAYGGKVTQPTAPTAEGYTFGGWYKEAACTNAWNFANTTVTGAQELFAKWTIQSFTLAWDANGGSELTGNYTHGTVQYGTTIVAPNDPTRTGYTFTGWSPAVAETMPAADVTYTATWTEAGDTPYKVEHYQQNILDDEYVLVDTDNLTGKTGAAITPASKGYTGFANPTYTAATIAANGSTVMKLYYDRLTYTITWVDGDGNTIESDANVKYGATPSYDGATPTKTATSQYTYTFTGWNPVIAAVTGAQTYTATFDAVKVTEQSIEVTDEKLASELLIGDDTELSVAATGHLIIDQATTLASLTLHYADAQHAQVTGIEDLTAQQVSVVWHMPTPDGGVAGHWFAFAVPFDVNVTGGIFVNGNNTAAVSGKDFVIEEYDGNLRATTQSGWTRVAKTATLHAGHLYMLYVASAATWCFQAADPASLAEASTVSVAANASSIGSHHAGWNGIANTLYRNAEGAYDDLLLATVYNNTYSVYTATTLDEQVFTAASPFFVQVAAAGTFDFSNAAESPVARRASEGSSALSSLTLTNAARTFTDKAYIEVTDNSAEQYTIGHDLQKMQADAPAVPQLWLNAYDLQLAAHRTALDNDQRTVQVGLYAPAEAEYTIALNNVPNDLEVYLTKDGLPVWNITNTDYTLPLSVGNNDGYGLHIKRVKDIVTGVSDTNSQVSVQKVVINDQLYILRDGKTYSVTGAKVEGLNK